MKEILGETKMRVLVFVMGAETFFNFLFNFSRVSYKLGCYKN